MIKPKKCWSCDKYVKMEYHNGSLPNNEDEYYMGNCENCEESFCWEPNYDDVIRIKRPGKFFVISKNQITGKSNYPTKVETISSPRCNFVKIKCPAIAMSEGKLSHYIFDEYQKVKNGY